MDHLASIVLRKLQETFPVDLQPAAEALLRSGEMTSAEGLHRIQLAAIRLSHGDLERLTELMSLARIDYRDVLAPAEFPRQMRTAPGTITAEMVAADRAEYDAWLEGTEPGETKGAAQ
ncbi:MAG: hypothetical protein U9N84_10195 [Actinomycetota bacterium]|nr:hypothetical protein [Actinomycetota bacterium]